MNTCFLQKFRQSYHISKNLRTIYSEAFSSNKMSEGLCNTWHNTKFGHDVYLIKHPLKANGCSTLILGSATLPVKVVNGIQGSGNSCEILSARFHCKYFTMGTYVWVIVDKCLKPPTSWSLHWQYYKIVYRCATTLLPANKVHRI